MACGSDRWLLSIIILVLVARIQGAADENGVKTAVFLSPEFEMEPGSVTQRLFHNIDFPKGHIAVKSFDAEVVDKAGNPVPLHEAYLHHWIAMRYYYQPKADESSRNSDFTVIKNSGICDEYLPQYFGLGSETRKTNTLVPDPYGIEVGNPEQIPAGYEEGWEINLHAIDTRGAEDKLGCIECRCELYNVTKDEDGNDLEPGYLGGMSCCRDGTKCRLIQGFGTVKRSLFLKYTVKYLDWNDSILPVKIYVLDVTARWYSRSNGTKQITGHHCQVEYQVESCPGIMAQNDCINTKNATINLPSGGEVIYGVAHQHSGGVGSTLFGQDGKVICSSIPIYGEGGEPGNESGYIVGMTTCYPQPGTIKINNGESLILVSNYTNSQRHTGVMGLFYLLVSEPRTNPNSTTLSSSNQMNGNSGLPNYAWIAIVSLLVAAVLAIVFIHQRKYRNRGYETVAK